MSPNASPTVADMVGETESFLCTVAFYGPPVVFFAAPWLGLGLVLIGPFALVVTLVVSLLAAATLAVGIVAILALPFLMFRSRRAARASIVEPRRVVA